MVADRVTKAVMLSIVRDGMGWTVYDGRAEMDVVAGQLSNLVKKLEGTPELPGIAEPTSSAGKRFERYLDVEAAEGDAVQAFVFLLDARFGGKHRLEFADPPFIPLPINFAGAPSFITQPTRVTDRLAYFLCDVAAARRWTRAQGIPDHWGGHRRALTIPFCFNLIDPALGGAPWVISSEPPRGRQHSHHGDDDDRHDEHDHHHGTPRARTHGGVHPAAASFLIVDVPESEQ